MTNRLPLAYTNAIMQYYFSAVGHTCSCVSYNTALTVAWENVSATMGDVQPCSPLATLLSYQYLTVVRWSSAIWRSRQHDERVHQARLICVVWRCTRHWLWTAETRCQCSHQWWSAALNSLSYKSLSLHPDSTVNHSCRNNTSHCSLSSTPTPQLNQCIR